jgi:NADH-quinone oxidoreductase subunit L
MHASIILLLPFFSALLILLGHRQLKGASVLISVGSSVISFIACLFFLAADDDNRLLLPFIEVGAFNAGIDALIDKQSRGMMFIVSFVGMLVHIFSLGYMKDDEAKPRFFGSLSLFMFSMTGIVLAGNLFMMFIFWELVGLSSYLLIGHWYQKASAAEACKKAFLTNRIGDFGFMIGILLLFGANGGNVNLIDLETAFTSGPLRPDAPGYSAGFTTAAALCIFLGAVGKSAQFPLHVWLPDAMEGPTPVSALIHAATMVAAGVYMLVRVSFLVTASPLAAEIIAGIGCGTALLAALMATQQNDIKRVLAYSTLSQLGYMVMAVGRSGTSRDVPPLHARFLQGDALPWLWRGDLCLPPRAGHLENGRPAQAHAGHLLDLRHWHRRSHGCAVPERFLEQGSRSRSRL